MKHTFAISAYGESPYLEACIRSLKVQSVRDGQAYGSDIIICTSTPNAHIAALAEKYGLRLFVRGGKSSLKDDWNFAAETAVRETDAELVTIAHQDDVYDREYAHTLQEAVRKYPDISVFCARCGTIDGEGRPLDASAEKVKRILRLPLRLRGLADRQLVKRLPLVFGNGIGCPGCSYHIALTGLPLFQNDYRFVIDWETLLRLSRLPGRFYCAETELFQYRVHAGAETKKNIADHNREREEREIFASLWPAPVTALLMHFYQKAYRDYDADAV